MAEKLTPQQLQAVTDRGGNLLVSAAAGSGKTKVLVDRLLGYLTDPVNPQNLDSFLIITYTKAAASELRGKIASKLSERIALDPGNRHLQKQMQRLYLTKISTVHAFCTDILREYAYQLDVSGDFRVADENEVIELQARAMQEVLGEAYENADNDPDFCAFIDSQGFGRDDSLIPEIILKVYNSANCHLDPNGWLDTCGSISCPDQEDAGKTVWGEYLLSDLKSYVALQIDALTKCVTKAMGADGMEKPVALLNETIHQLSALHSCRTWDDVIGNCNIDYGRLTFPKQVTDLVLVEQIKAVREACKKGLPKRLCRFSDNSAQILKDLQASMSAVRGLIALVKKFKIVYDRSKKRRGILDFGDLEQKTLDLLLGKQRSGITSAAREIGDRFCEVMVDEYQDSNAVQDAIFGALTSKRRNCFMVGDVKQSIYQFRLADPSIFLSKYHAFLPAEDAAAGQDRKVILSKNFRSAGSVIDAVNDVFSACMSDQVGGLNYGDDEKLQEGVPHIPVDETEVELFAIDVKEDTYAEEASFVADKIKQLLNGTHMVRQGDELRPIKAEDIVILLRSPGSVGWEFQYALEQRGIRCSTDAGSNLLQSEEIEVLRALLNVIDNPLQDIPLVAVLSSRVFGFTADDLAAMRSGQRNIPIYNALQKCTLSKAEGFIETLTCLRKEAKMNGLGGLIQKIFALTRMDTIYSAMPDGDLRLENLQAFCQMADAYEQGGKGSLTQFLSHLDALEQWGMASTANKGDSDAVTIMSIHKSKGLEFPVVFLCGLSREFNRESIRAQVLCDNDLGLGVVCVDPVNRVRYPTIAKRAIAAKITAESLSEEMRVLYVAMTRARDRLIMTYALKNVEKEINDLSMRIPLSDPLLLTGNVDCPGEWVLLAALLNCEKGWNIQIVDGNVKSTDKVLEAALETVSIPNIEPIRNRLNFTYQHLAATNIPSKQTATQLKGRAKDHEAAENTTHNGASVRRWTDFHEEKGSVVGSAYGDAVHLVMKHLQYDKCGSYAEIVRELHRLKDGGLISKEQFDAIRVNEIVGFFETELGISLKNAQQIIREFKFSILEDADKYYESVKDEKILLQGVVDCAIVEDDGITVIDFKTDRVTDETIDAAIMRYRSQVQAYANALERIYQKPIKSAQLHFFALNRAIPV